MALSHARTMYVIVIGLRHFDQRQVGPGAFGSPCDMQIGALDLPGVPEKLGEMGRQIQKLSPSPSPAPHSGQLYDCVKTGGSSSKQECLPSGHGFPGLPLASCQAVCK